MQNDVIGNIMDKTLDNLKSLADGETVIGKTIYAPDGTMVLPVSKVTIGMVSGGGEYGLQKFNGDFSGAGAGGAGASITPIGFLLLGKNANAFIKADSGEEGNKWIAVASSVAKLFSKKKDS
ncbi:MAG: hypothetical protein K5753_00440 [Clostridia bacterium]|nr:hypothetical protein [Clostridia bacterium]